MKLELPLAQMSLAEKLEAMETLWADLSQNARGLATPEWHARVLEQRERRLAAGEEEILDWEEAKRRLRQEIHEGQILESVRRDLRTGYNFYERQQKGVGEYFLSSLFAGFDFLTVYGGIHPLRSDGRCTNCGPSNS